VAEQLADEILRPRAGLAGQAGIPVAVVADVEAGVRDVVSLAVRYRQCGVTLHEKAVFDQLLVRCYVVRDAGLIGVEPCLYVQVGPGAERGQAAVGRQPREHGPGQRVVDPVRREGGVDQPVLAAVNRVRGDKLEEVRPLPQHPHELGRAAQAVAAGRQPPRAVAQQGQFERRLRPLERRGGRISPERHEEREVALQPAERARRQRAEAGAGGRGQAGPQVAVGHGRHDSRPVWSR
jgi:hypothetical protein